MVAYFADGDSALDRRMLTVKWRCWQAIGYLIPLMDAEYANYYTREVMLILIREFQSPDEEMKKIVLKVVKQCCATDGVEPGYIKDEVLPPFFKHFWNQRMALDRRNYRQVLLLDDWYRHGSVVVFCKAILCRKTGFPRVLK